MKHEAAIWTAIVITNLVMGLLFLYFNNTLLIKNEKFQLSGVLKMEHKDGAIIYSPIYEKEIR